MSRVQFGVIATLLAVMVLLQVAPIAMPDRTGPRWDYRVEDLKDEELLSDLNSIGNGGWELVFARRAMSGDGNDQHGVYEVIFRRPR